VKHETSLNRQERQVGEDFFAILAIFAVQKKENKTL
jgi:hypothetical protein